MAQRRYGATHLSQATSLPQTADIPLELGGILDNTECACRLGIGRRLQVETVSAAILMPWDASVLPTDREVRKAGSLQLSLVLDGLLSGRVSH